jgi:tetratricopeptide (TPR) repeat protein
MKAKEEQWFLHNMHLRHVFNVLWYMACVVILLYFFRYIVFRDNYIMALIAAVLFTAHPIHTEVVANVKSRDEIMSLMLICSTFIFAFKYYEQKNKAMLAAAMVSLFLAFLAKEYAITMLLLIPLAFYLFNGFSIAKCFTATLPYIAVVAAYLKMRFSIVAPMNESSDNDLLNNPYANADKTEQVATKISTSLNYIKLLLFPHPLSSDYSYNTIPYKKFSHPQVWASLIAHGGLFYGLFYYFKKRHVLAFALAFYLLNLLIVCNLIFNIGGTMGERLVFHSSVGFCIAVAWLLYKAMEKIKPAASGRLALAGCIVLITALYGFKTIDRNTAWKNDETLFSEDIKTTPNSVLVNSNVASSFINKAEAEPDSVKKFESLRTGIKYYNKVLEIHPTFVSGFMNRGVAYLKLTMPDSAKANYDMAMKLYPNYPKLYEVYYNLGVCYYLSGRIQDAVTTWQQVTRMNPQYILAQQSINTAMLQLQAAQQQQQQQQGAAAPPPPPGK